MSIIHVNKAVKLNFGSIVQTSPCLLKVTNLVFIYFTAVEFSLRFVLKVLFDCNQLYGLIIYFTESPVFVPYFFFSTFADDSALIASEFSGTGST